MDGSSSSSLWKDTEGTVRLGEVWVGVGKAVGWTCGFGWAFGSTGGGWSRVFWLELNALVGLVHICCMQLSGGTLVTGSSGES